MQAVAFVKLGVRPAAPHVAHNLGVARLEASPAPGAPHVGRQFLIGQGGKLGVATLRPGGELERAEGVALEESRALLELGGAPAKPRGEAPRVAGVSESRKARRGVGKHGAAFNLGARCFQFPKAGHRGGGVALEALAALELGAARLERAGAEGVNRANVGTVGSLKRAAGGLQKLGALAVALLAREPLEGYPIGKRPGISGHGRRSWRGAKPNIA